jgi:hypothetical protein
VASSTFSFEYASAQNGTLFASAFTSTLSSMSVMFRMKVTS